MLDEKERKRLHAAERVAFYEDVMTVVQKRLDMAIAERAALCGDEPRALPKRLSGSIDAAKQQFAPTAQTAQAFITVEDLADISRGGGWWIARAHVMKDAGFREAQPYLMGTRTRVWVRGDVTPSAIQHTTQYVPARRDDGTLGVKLRRTEPPKLPY